jgi:NADH dehydrogenase
MREMPEGRNVPHVVIIGGGFGGLEAARRLADAPVRVTIVDRRNHHLFQPLLYQVATGGLSAAEIAMPIRKILREQRNLTVLLAEVQSIDPASRRVQLADGGLDYDYLIVATGATHTYFGNDAWARYAPGLKSIEDAFEIRRRVFLAFEHAEATDDPAERAAQLSFVVVGAGPTGVELAGTLAEIARETLVHDFRRIDPTAARIVLVDATPNVLGAFSPNLREAARGSLHALGVEVLTGQRVVDVDGDGVELKGPDGAVVALRARTVLWAAGVQGSPLGRMLDAELEPTGQVKVAPTLTVPNHPDIFVVGDLASLTLDGARVPALAPAAIQMGRLAAKNIERAVAKQPLQSFRYVDRGTMATIGRAAAVARVGRFEMTGLLAWLAWVFVHLMTLVGFRNRVITLVTWIWAYFTYQRAGRLILETPAATLARTTLTPGDGLRAANAPAAPARAPEPLAAAPAAR